MGWDRTKPTNPKYRAPAHRQRRDALVAQLEAGQPLTCTATVCVMPTRLITNPDGRARDGLHLGHADNGIDYAGPQHNACNVTDGARRARAKQNAPRPRRWVV